MLYFPADAFVTRRNYGSSTAFGLAASSDVLSVRAAYFLWYRFLPEEDTVMTMALSPAYAAQTMTKGGVEYQ
jgi:hypothetical protein